MRSGGLPLDEWVLPGFRYRSTAGDVANTVAVLALGVLFQLTGLASPADPALPLGQTWMPVVLMALCTIPLMLKRRLPATSVAVSGVIVAVGSSLVTGSLEIVPLLAFFDTLFAAALLAPRRTARLVPAIAAAVVAAIIVGARPPTPAAAVAVVVTVGALVLVPLTWGASVRQRDALVRAERDRADAIARAAAAERAAAVRAERTTMAGELHDEIAARLSAISLQASALDARRDVPDDIAGAVRSMRASSREALGELRELIAVLAQERSEEQQPPRALPDPPTALREAAVSFGVALELTDDATGDGRGPLPEHVADALARIGREAVVNAARHAPGARVDVSLRRDGDAIAMDIVNALTERTAPAAMRSGGLGTELMAERWAAAGGTGEAGPTEDGRWRIAVRIPCPPAPDRETGQGSFRRSGSERRRTDDGDGADRRRPRGGAGGRARRARDRERHRRGG